MATAQTATQAAHRGARLTAAPLIVLGGGEHARVVIEAARSRPDQWLPQGYAAPEASSAIDLPWLGDDTAVARQLADLSIDDRPRLVIGFGGAESGPGLARRIAAADRFAGSTEWATVIHATAWISPSAVVEAGAVVLAHAVVNTGARIGRHAIVNSAAVVEHDVVVGDGCHVAPGAVIGGGARIGAGSFVGLGSRVRDHIEVGARATVGMGAVVVRAVAPGETVIGVPARRPEPRR